VLNAGAIPDPIGVMRSPKRNRSLMVAGPASSIPTQRTVTALQPPGWVRIAESEVTRELTIANMSPAMTLACSVDQKPPLIPRMFSFMTKNVLGVLGSRLTVE
jgi:hypothetical protein